MNGPVSGPAGPEFGTFGELLRVVPPDALNIALVLALAFFIGLEREEHKQRVAAYGFGGVRTFPLIGLVSYALALLSGPSLVPWTAGFVVVGGFMLLSYFHKLESDPAAGFTTEVSALATYAIGGLVHHQSYWLAATIGVVAVLLLELKKGLEGLTRFVASREVVTFAKFLVLAVVVLPIVPNRELTRFHVNPFKTWLVVVAVSGVSFASYVLQRLLRERGGVLLSAVLGGAYSSTVTTVVLARRSREDAEPRPNLFAGSILTASGMMYARLVLLVALFNATLAGELAPAFATLAAAACLAGWAVSRRTRGAGANSPSPREPKNPLELGAAFLFAGVFVLILVLTGLVRETLGRAGLYTLAAVMGVTDVDPFILGLAQGGASATPLSMAAPAIVIAAASNNAVKAIYAYAFADPSTGRRSLALLLVLAALGLVPLVWM
ncbi:MAG: MgtC/SapB family protein [Thermoanaerobaculia bacterium]